METKLINGPSDYIAAQNFFNQAGDWTNAIDDAVAGKQTPYLLIGSYSEDIEFGEIYKFIAVDARDLVPA